MKCDEYAEVLLTLSAGTAHLAVRGPDGRVILAEDYDAEHARGARGWVSDGEGAYVVELRFTGPRVLKPYDLTVTAARATQELDDRRLRAQRLDDELARDEHHAHDGEAAAPWLARNRDLVDLYRQLGDAPGEAIALTRLGLALDDDGDAAQANALLERALALRQGRGWAEAEALNWLGFVCVHTGDYEKALAYLQRGLPLARASGRRPLVGALLGNLGTLYGYLKEERKSIRYNREALLFADDPLAANTLAIRHNLGVSYLSLGEPARARPFFEQARAGWEANGDTVNLGPTLTALALLHRGSNETDEALRLLEQALPLVKQSGNRQDEIATYVQLGATYAERHEPARAKEQYEAAYALLQTLDRSSHPYIEWWVPLGFAQLAADDGDFAEARKWLAAASAVVEASRASLGSRDLRAMFFASTRALYDTYVDVLMREHAQNPAAGADRLAFEISERSRARTLLEMLTSAEVDLDQGLSPALAERARALYAKLDAKAILQMKRLQAGRAEAGDAVDRDLRQITSDLDVLGAEIRERSPQYGSIADATPVTVADVQALLDPDTVLLEYSLGHERSFLWVVTPTTITSHVLPTGKEIEALARRLHELATARNRPGKGTAAERLARIAADEREYDAVAARLGRVVLGAVPRPEGKRILVAADGALHYVPFAALPQPAAWRAARPSVIADYEVVNLPSAAVVAALRREAGARVPAPKRMFVLADPVFDAGDRRLAAPRASAEAPTFPRLAYTRFLADHAMRALPPGEGATVVDFEANREAAMSPRLADYRLVVFATHGVLNNDYPELSGVVLSLVDGKGEAQNGFLRMHDVYGMKLNADAVVLGACETGLGKEMKGEGLVGLSRGFMYAGARRVVATLWKVDEEATVELLRGLVEAADRDGKPYSTALREAQLRIRGQGRWRSPYYWAGVTLQGEWR